MRQDLLLVFHLYLQNTPLVLLVVLLTRRITDTVQGFFLSFPVLFHLEPLFLLGISNSWREVTITATTTITKCCSFISQLLISRSHVIHDAVILSYGSIQLLKFCLPSPVARRTDRRFPHSIRLFHMEDRLVHIGVLDVFGSLIKELVTLFFCLWQLIQSRFDTGRVLQLLRVVLQDLHVMAIQTSFLRNTGMITRYDLL